MHFVIRRLPIVVGLVLVPLLLGNGTVSANQPACDTTDFVSPLNIPLEISNTFGPRILGSSSSRYDFHRGVDWPAVTGTPIFAVADGIVDDFDDGWVSGTGGGNNIHIDHAALDCETYYAHLSVVDPAIQIGAAVVKGQQIGEVGNTGASSPHLHFGVRDIADGTQRDSVHPLRTPFLPWTDTATPTTNVIASFVESEGVAVVVEVVSPFEEPDILQIDVSIDGGADSRSLNFDRLNSTTAVVDKLDDPTVDDICIIAADELDVATGQKVTVVIGGLAGGVGSDIVAEGFDVVGNSTVDQATVSAGLTFTPESQTLQIGPEQIETMNFTLTNNSGQTLDLDLTQLTAQGWDVAVTPSAVNLVDGQAVQVSTDMEVRNNDFGPPDCGIILASTADGSITAAGFYQTRRDTHVSATTGADIAGNGTEANPFATIGYAIGETDPGGTINVAAGTYNENVDVGRNVDLLGGFSTDFSTRTFALNNTIIDGGGTVVPLEISGDYGPFVEGFTIKNGFRSGSGGGVRASGGAAPTLQHNWIIDNTATSGGGGIYVASSGFLPPTIVDNTISSNDAQSTSGGGGGIYVDGRPADIRNNDISNNQASGNSGGGLYLKGDTAATVTGNRVTGNTAADDGGGLLIESSNALIANNFMSGNTAVDEGDGVHVSGSTSPTLTYNTITSGILLTGTGISAGTDSFPTVANNIITDFATGVDCSSLAPIISNILNNGTDIDPGCDDRGNLLQTDPLLVDELHLSGQSPAIDAADPTYTRPDDFDGDVRPIDGDGDGQSLPDIGADEFVPESDPPPVPITTPWAMAALALLFAAAVALRRTRRRMSREAP